MLRTPPATDPALERVRALASPIASAQGVDLVDVAWSSDRGTRVLRVVLELAGLAARQLEVQLASLEPGAEPAAPADPAGGVSLEDCARFSRRLSEALDADEGAVPGAYVLEVSSPGLERALLTPADFVRFRGATARVKLARPAADGQKLLRGVLVELGGVDAEALRAGDRAAAKAATLTMRVDGRRVAVPFADVVDASLVYVFADDAPARAAKPKGTAPKGDAKRKGGAKPARAAAPPRVTQRSGEPGASDQPASTGRGASRAPGARTSQASRSRSRT